ncbi:hypothetical protein [Pseudonocardia sp.]|jgi:integrase|uniref:hypothetical protein n=1 Tax=Pseudonocardia sp. TaxID=60912 RepID=UPI00260FD9AE|nr:hypothetical protein [Pseudonocardia sp.]
MNTNDILFTTEELAGLLGIDPSSARRVAASAAKPRTNSTIRAPWRCPTGRHSRVANAFDARSADKHPNWGDVTIFAPCTAARIGEVSGCRIGDNDTTNWLCTIRRQTTPSPGGLIDKGTKGKLARVVPLIADVRNLVQHRIDAAQGRETRDCSPDPAAAASPQRSSATPPTETRS